jgi:hypothetical protein
MAHQQKRQHAVTQNCQYQCVSFSVLSAAMLLVLLLVQLLLIYETMKRHRIIT